MLLYLIGKLAGGNLSGDRLRSKETAMARVKSVALTITAVCGAILAIEKVVQMAERRLKGAT